MLALVAGFTPPGGRTNIALGPPMGSFQPPHSTGIAISTKDAHADHEELKANGVDVDENLMGGDGTVPLMFGLRDGDGNTLMIVESHEQRYEAHTDPRRTENPTLTEEPLATTTAQQ